MRYPRDFARDLGDVAGTILMWSSWGVDWPGSNAEGMMSRKDPVAQQDIRNLREALIALCLRLDRWLIGLAASVLIVFVLALIGLSAYVGMVRLTAEVHRLQRLLVK